MKKIKVIDIKCPKCKEPICYGEIIKMDNNYKDFEDVISQEVECLDCKIKFEVIFVPIEINKLK